MKKNIYLIMATLLFVNSIFSQESTIEYIAKDFIETIKLNKSFYKSCYPSIEESVIFFKQGLFFFANAGTEAWGISELNDVIKQKIRSKQNFTLKNREYLFCKDGYVSTILNGIFNDKKYTLNEHFICQEKSKINYDGILFEFRDSPVFNNLKIDIFYNADVSYAFIIKGKILLLYKVYKDENIGYKSKMELVGEFT